LAFAQSSQQEADFETTPGQRHATIDASGNLPATKQNDSSCEMNTQTTYKYVRAADASAFRAVQRVIEGGEQLVQSVHRVAAGQSLRLGNHLKQ